MRKASAYVQRLPISLLDYLAQQGWKATRRSGREEMAGLCPLHRETRPSFYVNRRKQVFYCHGCGRGGDLIRLVELLHGWSFHQALAHLSGPPPPAEGLLTATFDFYQQQLKHFPEAGAYLARRGIHCQETMARMRVGYAPGACLRAHLESLGYAPAQLHRAGVIDDHGRDRFWRCLTFPLQESGNLYGRSIDAGSLRHRFLPRPKGGLYGWQQARPCSSLILVEGILDWAVLWQAGVCNVVAGLGTYLNQMQMGELGDSGARRIYICLDGDAAGARAAQRLARMLHAAGIDARRVRLPDGHDPNSFFVAGATAADFQSCLDEAQP